MNKWKAKEFLKVEKKLESSILAPGVYFLQNRIQSQKGKINIVFEWSYKHEGCLDF